MAVYIHAEIRRFSDESVKVYSSGVHSGIIGHPGTNTYHQSIENLPNQSGYTNYWKNDKAPPGGWSRQYAVADDLSLSRNDMITDWRRHKAVFDDHSDPRRPYFAEYIGTPDGVTAYRLDFADGSVEESDDSHTWHAHNAAWRKFYNTAVATDARLSVRRGQTKAQYIAATSGSGSGEDEDLKTLLGKITGRGTVFRGMGMPGTLMPLHSERAYNDLKAQGATEYWYGGTNTGNAGSLVDVLGTLPLTTVEDGNGGYRWETTDENYGRSVAVVEAAG